MAATSTSLQARRSRLLRAGEPGWPGSDCHFASTEQSGAEQDDSGQIDGAQAQVQPAAVGKVTDIITLLEHQDVDGYRIVHYV